MIKKAKGYFKVDRGFFDLRLRPHVAMVYLYLLSSINKDTRQCWPSMKTIARKLDISKSTVEKAIVELAKKHLIIKSNRSRDSRIISNLYTLPDGVGYYHKKGMDEFLDILNGNFRHNKYYKCSLKHLIHLYYILNL